MTKINSNCKILDLCNTHMLIWDFMYQITSEKLGITGTSQIPVECSLLGFHLFGENK